MVSTADMKFSVKAARAYSRSGEYGAAVANYMAVLKFVPAHAADLENEFLFCFDTFLHHLEEKNRTDDANEYYSLISEFYSRSPRFLTQWGNFLSRQSLHEEAAIFYLKSLDIQPDYSEAIRSLRNLRYSFIDQWHFRMLNDRQRNGAYEQGLSICMARCCLPTPTVVLDIGSGTGILSMLALEAGAQKVYACEHSKVMCQMAKKIFVDNGFDEEIQLIEKHSSDIDPFEDMNGERAHLLVTELMDAGFFGESIVRTVLDAKERLLAPDGIILPARAKIWACLIECETVRLANSVLYDGAPVSIYSSLSSDPMNSATSPSGDAVKRREPYTTAMLSKIKGGYRYLSRPFVIDEIDLNDLDDLKRHVSGISNSISVTITESGSLDAVACWFEVNLTPPSITDTRIFICTKPENVETAWEQAIFPVHSISRHQAGSNVEIDTYIRDNWMQCSIRALPLENPEESQSSPVIIDDSTSLIELMNDDTLAKFFLRFIDKEPKVDQRCDSILDLTCNPRLAAEAGNNRRVWSVLGDPNAVLVAEACLKQMGSTDRVLLASSIHRLPNADDDEQKFELLHCPVETCGLLKQNALEDLAFSRLSFPIQRIVPSAMAVHGVLIESDELDRYARVTNDQNTLGLKIKNVFNVFETDAQRDLELSTLNHKRLSESMRLMTLDFTDPIADRERLPGFLEQRAESSLRVLAAGKVSALVFWYELLAVDDEGIGTSVSTIDPQTHFRVAASLVTPFGVSEDDLVSVSATLDRSELYFNVNLINWENI